MNQRGEIVREARKARDLTQRDLAHLSGVSHSMICKIERGEVNASDRVFRDLHRALGTDWATSGHEPAAVAS